MLEQTVKTADAAEPFTCGRVDLYGSDDATEYVDFDHADAVTVYQSSDGPVQLVIGIRASDEALRRAAQRFGLSVSELQVFRDSVEASQSAA